MNEEIKVYSESGAYLGSVSGPGFSVAGDNVVIDLHEACGAKRDILVIGRAAPQVQGVA